MTNPQLPSGQQYANDANGLSTSFAWVLPRAEETIGDFVFVAALALGVREADLARQLGISRATLSSWKARGSIPGPHLQWFKKEFVYNVLTAPTRGEVDTLHAGTPAVLRLFRSTDFNAFGLVDVDLNERIEISYRYLGLLARLAQFVQLRSGYDLEPRELEAHAAVITGELARAAASRLFPGREVSQAVSQ